MFRENILSDIKEYIIYFGTSIIGENLESQDDGKNKME